ncbi:reverse transcriptase domain-containing protein, partial [Tanacetum coccineum]
AKLEKSGRIAKWAIDLGEHDIELKGRNSIKGHILADFLAETLAKEVKEDHQVQSEERDLENTWKLYIDGASSFDGYGAEYEALLAGLRIATKMKIEDLDIFVDSQLVANQNTSSGIRTGKQTH